MPGLFDDLDPVTPEVIAEEATTEETPVVEAAEEAEIAVEADAEESDEEDEGEEVVYDIDGEEVSKETLVEWKAAAEKVKAAEVETAKVTELREQLAAKTAKLDESLSAIEAAEGDLEAMLLGDLANVDLKALRADDYQEYLRTKEAIEERKGEVKALKEKFAGVKKQQIQEQAATLAEIRGWSTDAKRNEDLSLLNDFAKSAGFNPDDMKTLTSARVVDALLKAAKKEKEFKEKSKARTKVVRPTNVKAKAKADTSAKVGQSIADRLFS